MSRYTVYKVSNILLSRYFYLSSEAIAVSCHDAVFKWLGTRKNHDEFMNPIDRVIGRLVIMVAFMNHYKEIST